MTDVEERFRKHRKWYHRFTAIAIAFGLLAAAIAASESISANHALSDVMRQNRQLLREHQIQEQRADERLNNGLADVAELIKAITEGGKR